MDKKYKFQKNSIYFQYLHDDIGFSITPNIIGYERCSSGKEIIGPLTKSIYLIHIVTQGKGYYKLGKKEFEVSEGGIFFMPPAIPLSYRPDKKNPWSYMWIEFNGINAKPLCDKAMLLPDSPVFYPADPEGYLKEFAEMIEESTSPNVSLGINTLSHLLNIFAMLIKERNASAAHMMNKAEKNIRPIVEYIEHNIGDSDMTLENISKKFYLNASYLSRIFKEVMGMPPSRYIIELRMQKAFDMLKSKIFSVKEISSALGYASPYYFSKEFKRYSKVTPTQYERENT